MRPRTPDETIGDGRLSLKRTRLSSTFWDTGNGTMLRSFTVPETTPPAIFMLEERNSPIPAPNVEMTVPVG
ncbi:MAG: hypothetical protein JO165_12065 [Candidatus Eremiobacteraeota bacterium]|nr:hypothetical protein [Candidatus Eremiobacteraeota bacterium]